MTPATRRLRYFRFAVIGIATIVGLLSLASCSLTIMMKNVYFRPVHRAVETGEGDPYMIALDCVAVIAAELEPAITCLALSALAILACAIIVPRSPTPNPDSQDGG